MSSGLFMEGSEPLQPTGHEQGTGKSFNTNAIEDSSHGGEADSERELDSLQLDTDETRSNNGRPTSKADNGKKRSLRVPGGHAATCKKITEDYDSDDGRIVELKQQGYSDEFVADKLKQEGRTRYVGKTVGSRWNRLRDIIEQKEDEILDDELSDWHVGEDEKLDDSVKVINEKLDQEIERLREKKWKNVSVLLAEKLQKRKYTAKACKERFEDVQAGTALLPIELDSDQAGRRRLREDRVAAAKAARIAAKEALRQIEQSRLDRAAAKKQALADADQLRNANRQKRESEKAEAVRIRAERRRRKERARKMRHANLIQLRLERDWKLEQSRKEKEIYKTLTGRELGSSSIRLKTDKAKDESEEESEAVDDFESDEDDAQTTGQEHAGSEKEFGQEDTDEDSIVVSCKAPIKTPSQQSLDTLNSNSPRSKGIKANAKATGPIKGIVTAETLANPRTVMSRDELHELTVMRDLPRPTPSESHPELVARLVAYDSILTSEALSALLRDRAVKIKGTKDAKIRRLQEADAAASDAGKRGVRVTSLPFMRRYDGYKGAFSYVLGAAEQENGIREAATAAPAAPAPNRPDSSNEPPLEGEDGYSSEEIPVIEVKRRMAMSRGHIRG